MLVHQILNSKGDNDVVTVKPGTLVSEAAKLLTDKRIGTVVISKSGNTADGILSERDIVWALASQGAACLTCKVEDFMTENLTTARQGDSADEVLAKMTEGRFRHMPVLEEGKMIGLITQGDVVKARLSELAMEKDALEGMIMGH